MDVQILFRIECVDDVALQAMLQSHPGGAAREVQAGGRCKVGRVVQRLFDVEWRGRQKNSELGSAGNMELRARIDALDQKEGVQGLAKYPFWRRRGSDAV